MRPNGLSVFMYGDVVIMDNCGFHHGRLTEGTLREMFEMRGVTLLFQPPYSPHFNTCEYCFHEMKQQLRSHEPFSQAYTEIAIMDALSNITTAHSRNYFHCCGYII